MFSLICAWMKDWVNSREAGDLRRHRGHYDVNVMASENNLLKLLLYVSYGPKRWSVTHSPVWIVLVHVTCRYEGMTKTLLCGIKVPRRGKWDVHEYNTVTWPRYKIKTYFALKQHLSASPCAFYRKKSYGFRFPWSLILTVRIVDNRSGLVLVKAWRRWGNKLLHEPVSDGAILGLMLASPEHTSVWCETWT